MGVIDVTKMGKFVGVDSFPRRKSRSELVGEFKSKMGELSKVSAEAIKRNVASRREWERTKQPTARPGIWRSGTKR